MPPRWARDGFNLPFEGFRDAHHGPYSLDSIMYGHILSVSTACVKFGAVHLRERYLEHGPRISRFEPLDRLDVHLIFLKAL